MAQSGGSLTPPIGQPQQTMKSLDQIRPETPLVNGAANVSVVDAGTITISAPGSYYLVDHLVVKFGNGIVIDSSDVSLDLRGFTISSLADAASGFGIEVLGSRVSIINGTLLSGTVFDPLADGDQFTGTGFGTGIIGLSNRTDVRVSNVRVQGCDQDGIALSGAGTFVEHCTVSVAGNDVIVASLVTHSSAVGRECLCILIDTRYGESHYETVFAPPPRFIIVGGSEEGHGIMPHQ